jgi:phospholipase C
MAMSAGRRTLLGGAALLVAAAGAFAVADADPSAGPPPQTPIKHVVVIFGENQSFDHYFGTYPRAANPSGQPPFTAAPGTPSVNGLTPALLTANPNAANPRRLDRSEPVTCDHNHNYGAEQLAFNGGLMDKFVENTGGGSCADKGIVMAYYDGNTVSAMWNFAQHFAISDNHFGSTFGPSTIGAINFVSGNTHGVSPAGAGENGTMIGNSQPAMDDCSAAGSATTMSGANIGDLMNAGGVTWGWFAGGFKPTGNVGGRAQCASTHKNAVGADVGDYFPHHMPFQYYASTANPQHLPPTAVNQIGLTDQANHQYDLSDFDAALASGNLPQVSFLKAIASEDGHPGYSGPLDEQRFVVRTLNALQQSPEWESTAVFLAYDDSDGWYDHVQSPILQGSRSPSDALNGVGVCGPDPGGTYQGRCGPGPRLPLVLVSPYARQNYVDHTATEQASIMRFIEDNWALGRAGDQSFDARAGSIQGMFDFTPGAARAPKLILDPVSGLPPGAWPTPTPTPIATPTAAPTATPTPKPPVVTKPKLAVKLSCRTSGRGKRITVSCTASGKDASKRTALRFRIVKGSKVLATARVTLSRKKAKVVLRPSKALKKGRYTLRITITQTGGVLALTRTIRLK